MSSHNDSGHEEFHVHPHIAPLKLYIGIFMTLIFFTVVTVALSYVHLGSMNLLVAILIATLKASLVVTFFMHLKDDARFNALVFVGSLLFMGVFMVYTLNDTEHRGVLDDAQGVFVDPATGEAAPNSPRNRVLPEPAEHTEEH